jgi:RNA polymerase sigma-70 factor (ECF subfamily)
VSNPSSFAIELPDSVLAQARRGDARAFEQIYRSFERPVFTLATRMLGDRDEAMDLQRDQLGPVAEVLVAAAVAGTAHVHRGLP